MFIILIPPRLLMVEKSQNWMLMILMGTDPKQ